MDGHVGDGLDGGVLSPGKCVRNYMFLSRDMANFVPEFQRFQFKIQESWVGELRQFLPVTENGEEGLVIHTEREIGEAQDEELALV